MIMEEHVRIIYIEIFEMTNYHYYIPYYPGHYDHLGYTHHVSDATPFGLLQVSVFVLSNWVLYAIYGGRFLSFSKYSAVLFNFASFNRTMWPFSTNRHSVWNNNCQVSRFFNQRFNPWIYSDSEIEWVSWLRWSNFWVSFLSKWCSLSYLDQLFSNIYNQPSLILVFPPRIQLLPSFILTFNG